LPQLKQAEVIDYIPGEYADPFKPRSMKSKGSSSGLQPDMMRQKEFLEGFPLDALRMVGTLQKGGQIYALVRTPENALHRVKAGNYIGLNHGLIIAVNETGIELKEIIQDGAGDWAESKATLALQE
jgi:type IV pilus assembly protein PilP